MSKLLQYAQANPLIFLLGLLVAVLLLHFLIQYVARGLSLRSKLIGAVRRVGAIESDKPASIRPPLEAVFADTRLVRAWREFEESLHEQRTDVETDTPVIRATQPAEAFFNLETVVDPWIGSEYFRHLPGILTGLGIIGTFFGLIQGLIHFDPGLTDSADLKRGLGELFGHVRDAFMFSGTAIAAAIGVTIAEKWLYASCAKWVLELSAALDALFKPGVGEEYLASILSSSRDSAVQVRHLKSELVDDLRVLLTSLSERQVRATQQLSADLSRSIRQSLQEPLADIARSVAAASGRDTDAVKEAFEQLVSAFITQMRETMGRQLSDLSHLIQQTTQAVNKVEGSMRSLLEDVQKSGSESSTSLRAAVQEMLQRLSETQRAQSELVSSSMKDVLLHMHEAAVRMSAAQEEAARRTREETNAMSVQMRRQVVTVSDSHSAAVGAIGELLERFSGVSAQLVDKLTAGTAVVASAVSSLRQAAEELSRVGVELGGVADQANQSTHDMVRATMHLATAAQKVGTSIHQLSNAAVRFEGVASSASVEANARRQLLLSLQDVIDQSHVASREFVNLAQQARQALDTSLEHFGSDVSAVLTGHVQTYQKQLGESVISLRKALDQLAFRANANRDRH